MKEHVSKYLERLCKLPAFTKMILPNQRSIQLHSILRSCGHQIITDKSYLWHGLKRGDKPFATLQFTLRGWGELRFEHRTYKIERGKLMISLIPHNHKYYIPKNADCWEFLYLTIAGSEAIRILMAIQDGLGPVIHISSVRPLIIFEEILELAHRNDDNNFIYSSLVYSFLLSLLSDIYHVEIKSTHPKIKKALEICDQQYKNPLQINTLAKQLQISPYYFARLFHQEVGNTFQKYLESLRIHKAMEKIVNSSVPIKRVAHDCGFSTSTYFGQVFKKYYGESPSIFKKQAQN